jgi:hypothetical protein
MELGAGGAFHIGAAGVCLAEEESAAGSGGGVVFNAAAFSSSIGYKPGDGAGLDAIYPNNLPPPTTKFCVSLDDRAGFESPAEWGVGMIAWIDGLD